MNCSDWQTRIAADESDDGAVAEHVRACEACGQFARELNDNAAALRSIEVDPAAYAVLRARVMGAIEPKRRWRWLWAGAAALAAAASVALLWWTAPLRAPSPGRPRAIVYKTSAPAPIVRAVAVHKKKQASRPVLPQLAAIKLLTDDPNVVIIWLVDDKKETNDE